MAERSDKQSPSPAVTRAVWILDELARSSRPLGPTELARRLNLPKSSVANICTALVDVGLSRRIDGRYTLGRKIVELGSTYLANFDEVGEFHALCREMNPESEDTIQLAFLGDKLEVIYLARHDGSHPIRLASDIGRALPANCTATGKAVLATLSPDELYSRLPSSGTLPVLTSKSISSVDVLMSELESVRDRGYAIDDEETVEGLTCLAMAVPGGSRGIRWAVSVTLLKSQLDTGRIQQLTERLGILTTDLVRRTAMAP